MSSVADEIQEEAILNGARFRSTELVNLDDVSRSKFAWFSKRIREGLGVPAKPYNEVCPICRQRKMVFELDHMGPWRTYVAALGGNHITIGPNGENLIRRDIVKALYNDPQNLWWICKSCNGSKSDHAYEQATITPGNITHGPTRGRVSSIIG